MRIFEVSQHKKMWEYIALNVDIVWQIKQELIDECDYLSDELSLADATIAEIKNKYFTEKHIENRPNGSCYACDSVIGMGCIVCPLEIGDCCNDEDSYYNSLCYCLLNGDMCGFVYWCNQIKDAKINEGVVTDEIYD